MLMIIDGLKKCAVEIPVNPGIADEIWNYEGNCPKYLAVLLSNLPGDSVDILINHLQSEPEFSGSNLFTVLAELANDGYLFTDTVFIEETAQVMLNYNLYLESYNNQYFRLVNLLGKELASGHMDIHQILKMIPYEKELERSIFMVGSFLPLARQFPILENIVNTYHPALEKFFKTFASTHKLKLFDFSLKAVLESREIGEFLDITVDEVNLTLGLLNKSGERLAHSFLVGNNKIYLHSATGFSTLPIIWHENSSTLYQNLEYYKRCFVATAEILCWTEGIRDFLVDGNFDNLSISSTKHEVNPVTLLEFFDALIEASSYDELDTETAQLVETLTNKDGSLQTKNMKLFE